MFKWLDNLRVGTKLALIALAYTLPIAVLLHLLVREKDIAIDFAAQERDGIRYLAPLAQLLHELSAYSLGAVEASAELGPQAARLDADFERLLATDARLSIALKTTPGELARRDRTRIAAAAIAARWNQTQGQTGSERASGAGALVADVRELVAHVGDTSNLILDPDLDTYYTMDCVLTRLPEAFDLQARLMRALAKPTLSEPERRELSALAGALRANLAATSDSQQRAFKETANFNRSSRLKPALEPVLDAYLERSTRFLESADSVIAGTQVGGAAASLEAGRAALDAGLAFWEPAARELDSMLEARATGFATGKRRSLGAVAIVLLAVGLFVALVHRRITRRLRELHTAAEALARGQIGARRVTDAGGDEITALDRAMIAVTESQRAISEAARRLARGELSLQIEPRSDADVLGHAMLELSATMRELLSEAERLVCATREGALRERGQAERFEGAFAALLGGFNHALDAVQTPIEEATLVLERVAQRDLTARVVGEHSGDYARMRVAINLAVETLDQRMRQVAAAARHVAAVSGEIASSSQSVAQGATEQASALEQTSAALIEMASSTRRNADSAQQADELARGAHETSTQGKDAMTQMAQSVAKMRAAAERCQRRVKTRGPELGCARNPGARARART